MPEDFHRQRRMNGPRTRMYLIKQDRTFYELRTSPDFFHGLALEWEAFMEMPEETRGIVADALGEMRMGPGPLRYIREPFEAQFDKGLHQESFLHPDDKDT